VMIILEGKATRTIDGVNIRGSAGGRATLPLRATASSCSTSNKPTRQPRKICAAEAEWFECTPSNRGSGFEQLEDAPEYKK